MYLGSIITEDGKIASSINQHVLDKEKNLNKLISFLFRNSNAPFFVKVKVFKAAYSSSILYGMESWMRASVKPIERLYSRGLMVLLGVWQSKPDSLCYIESGIPPVKAIILEAQSKFYGRCCPERI